MKMRLVQRDGAGALRRPQAAGRACDSGAFELETNLAPLADPGGPYTGLIFAGISLDGGGSTDPEGDALTYAWDFGDGDTGAGPSVLHSYGLPGVYDVCLVVSDGLLASEEACITVTVEAVQTFIPIVYGGDAGSFPAPLSVKPGLP